MMTVIFVEMKLLEDGNFVLQDVSISIILPSYYFLPNLSENSQSNHVLIYKLRSNLWLKPFFFNNIKPIVL